MKCSYYLENKRTYFISVARKFVQHKRISLVTISVKIRPRMYRVQLAAGRGDASLGGALVP